jgi:ribA/ribD-fused uncharacterized protein
MEGVPPKFAPFKKTRVVLALEDTPMPIDQKTDLTAHPTKAFRAAEGGGAETGEEADAAVEPLMFGKKRTRALKAAEGDASEAKPRASKIGDLGADEALPEFLRRAKAADDRKKKRERASGTAKGAEGAATLFSRTNAASREEQAAIVASLPEDLQAKSKILLDVEAEIPYEIEPPSETFVPMTRRGFGTFIIDEYSPIFPTKEERKLDVATCAKKGEEGKKEVKIYHYQAFIREYLRYESPYRGLLVYHGLGSGKTCSAIAAAEALFGNRGSKIIVMTPFSLRDNFISEINFCGFKHFRLQNHWTSMSLKPGSTPEPGMVKMFATNVYGIPEAFFTKRVTRVWVPDFDSPPNFDSLNAQEKDEIQTQLKATIEHRIKFINYNGILARELKAMVCGTPDIFDNAVIVVDEIHNLTRLIQGNLERPFTKAKPLETLTPDRKPLPQCGMSGKYTRGYLFYRLFMGAKNSKIIGLSGTPLINFPEELGILMNILHGPIQTIDFVLAVEPGRAIEDIVKKIVNSNENLDTVFFMASEGSMSVTVTRLPEHFIKIFGDKEDILGIKRRDPLQAIPTLQQVWDSLAESIKAEKVVIRGAPYLKAQELLPSWDTLFRGAFLEEDGITLKNELVLQKRIRGLISYYRGIQGNVMPKVIKDEIVGIPLSGYSLTIYNKLRNQEIQVEMSKPKPQAASGGDAVWAEINDIATMKTPSNYRMSSRQACNFIFPEGVTRPRPRNLEELDIETGKDRDKIIEADMEDKIAGQESDAESVVDADDDEAKAQDALVAGAAGKAPVRPIKGSKEEAEAYRAAIKVAKNKLREMGQTHLQLEGPPERNLAKYSPKFAAMLKNIGAIDGSCLVYSQFLEMEGIGIFGICMEANGYVPIEIVPGGDGKLKFSDRTAASLAKGPKVKENRYIEFTGTGSKEQRGAAVSVFNARLDKLPPAMAQVLKDGGWQDNFDGGLCRTFCITSAGAEGLSLKAVRSVHIMEPYWNTVRTQQVKGRAVRICSHMDLPEAEQNVSIYTYCTTIPDEAVIAQAVDKTLERSDRFSAKDAAVLGVPVPPSAKGKEIDADLFKKVEEAPEAPIAEGAQAALIGPIRFGLKLENDYKGFLTMAPSPIVIDGKRYPTVEHYFQAMKFPDDLQWQEAIRVADKGLKARQLGEDKTKTPRADWEKVKEAVLKEALVAKFQQNRGLLQLLKETGTRPIVFESNDPYWGTGLTGKGKNRLGLLLVQVRTELREYELPVAVGDQAPLSEADVAALEEEEEEEAGADAAPPGSVGSAAADGSMAAAAAVLPVEVEGGRGMRYQAGGGLDAMPDELMPEEVQEGGGDDDDRDIILTSDQKVLLISLRKERVMSALQTLMKTVSVDCKLNFEDNNDGSFKCMDLGDNIGSFAYHPDLQKDIVETSAAFKVQEKAAPKVQESVGPAGGAGAAVAAAAPAAPAAPAARGPRLQIIKGYRGADYRYNYKLNPATGIPYGYTFYPINDEYGEGEPVGYTKVSKKGLPLGEISPEKPEWA